MVADDAAEYRPWAGQRGGSDLHRGSTGRGRPAGGLRAVSRWELFGGGAGARDGRAGARSGSGTDRTVMGSGSVQSTRLLPPAGGWQPRHRVFTTGERRAGARDVGGWIDRDEAGTVSVLRRRRGIGAGVAGRLERKRTAQDLGGGHGGNAVCGAGPPRRPTGPALRQRH